MFVYLRDIETKTWDVGFFHPGDGGFYVESSHDTRDEAAQRIHYLNGGQAGKRLDGCDDIATEVPMAELYPKPNPITYTGQDGDKDAGK